MDGSVVFEILQEKGIGQLFHANTVTTSETFLRQGGLVSRRTAEARGWPQTAQYTDVIDKQYGIWSDVFLDSDDYHRRISRPNQYGPVVFSVEARILTELPEGSEVSVTKANPTKWSNLKAEDRYFQTAAELRAGLVKGTFDQMVTLRIAGGVLPFGARLREVVLDDPSSPEGRGKENVALAMENLRLASQAGGVAAPIVQRNCNLSCKCVPAYQANWAKTLAHFQCS